MSINDFPMPWAFEDDYSTREARRQSFQRELDVAQLEGILQDAILLINRIRLPDHLQAGPTDDEGDEVKDEKWGKADEEPVEDSEEGEVEEDKDADSADEEVPEKGDADDDDDGSDDAGGKDPNDDDDSSNSNSSDDENNDPSTYPPLVPTSTSDPEVGAPWLALDGAVLMFRCSKSRLLEPWYKFVRKADGSRIKECTDHPGKRDADSNPHYPFPPRTYSHGEQQAKPPARRRSSTKTVGKSKGAAETKKTKVSATPSKKKK